MYPNQSLDGEIATVKNGASLGAINYTQEKTWTSLVPSPIFLYLYPFE